MLSVALYSSGIAVQLKHVHEFMKYSFFYIYNKTWNLASITVLRGIMSFPIA